ncbi:MAG TPA: DUF1795 domain-containing protein [Clostridiales bacterium]|nr:DUF1795 domain-containing protein [Clostridiales bacterium]
MNKTRRVTVAVAIFLALAVLFGCKAEDLGEWVPAGMKKISTDMVEYDLYIPKDWEEDISTGVVTAYVSSADRSSISMIAFDLEDPNQTVDEYWENNKGAFTSFFTDMQFEAEGEATVLGGVAARKYVYTASASGVPYKFMQVICIKEGTVYVFTYTAMAEKYELHLPSVEKILENFSFKS